MENSMKKKEEVTLGLRKKKEKSKKTILIWRILSSSLWREASQTKIGEWENMTISAFLSQFLRTASQYFQGAETTNYFVSVKTKINGNNSTV